MSTADASPFISIVVPMYNESEIIDEFYRRMVQVLDGIHPLWEIICVNDGSRDDTLEQLVQLHRRDGRVKVVDLSRNFGKEIALSAGLKMVSGEVVVPIDADLQDPPELIPELIAKWREGFDVVIATRRVRHGESWLKLNTARAFYWVINLLSDVEVRPNAGDFRLLSNKVVQELNQLPERNRFMKGLFSWVGFNQTAIYYDRHPRHAGRTKYNYWGMWNLAIDAITSFSSVPLRVWSYLGGMTASFAFLYAFFLVVRTLLYGRDWPGYASTIVVILFMGGVQLISLGVIGEYLSRIYIEVKQRPSFLVRESYGLKEKK